jgi:signal peptidase I
MVEENPYAPPPDQAPAEPAPAGDRPFKPTVGRRIAALLASLLAGVGAGQLTMGRVRRAALWLGAFFAALFAGLHLGPLALGAAIVIALAAAVDTLFIGAGRRGLPSWTWVIAAWAVVFALQKGIGLGVRTFYRESYKHPSASMAPTLLVGDHFFVRKRGLALDRGSVIVFRYPQDPEKAFVKRVVAVGGDTIAIENGVLRISGKPVQRRRLDGPCHFLDTDGFDQGFERRACVAYEERLGRRSYRVIEDLEAPVHRDLASTAVPPGHLFVVGDNRDNSHDSRFWGTVPLDHVVGEADVIWWSAGPEGIRWDRLNRRVR